MKNLTTQMLLSLLCLVFSLSENPLLVIANDPSDPVLDTTGQELRRGADYYVLPATSGNGGGIDLVGPQSSELCPLSLVQVPVETDKGLQWTFAPVNPDDPLIRVNTDLNVIFNGSNICVQSTIWRLSEVSGRYLVTIGGVEGNPGRETLSNWFKIEKNGDAYNFAFCPTVCDICRPICGKIGISEENGRRSLSLIQNNDREPFKVVFEKA